MTNMRIRSSRIMMTKIETTARVSRIRVDSFGIVIIIIAAPDKWSTIKMNSEIIRMIKVEVSMTYFEVKISEK